MKHDMRHLSCRLNICHCPPKYKSRKGAMKGSMKSQKTARAFTTCIECESSNCRLGPFKTKCYDCGLIYDNE